jgi:hypothetical protein
MDLIILAEESAASCRFRRPTGQQILRFAQDDNLGGLVVKWRGSDKKKGRAHARAF